MKRVMVTITAGVFALAGFGAAIAADDPHPPLHPSTADHPTTGDHPPTHPPTTTGEHPPTCDHQCPPPPPPVTVTVTQTTPAPPAQTTTVERPVERVVYVDRVVEKRVEVPVEKIVTKRVEVPVMKIVYRTKWKTRTVVQRIIRTKVIHDRCPPPDVCCEGKG
jgi:hypothetical protein